MNFKTAELTQQIGEMARDFAQQHIRPYVMQWDEAQEFPVKTFKEMESSV